MDPDKCGNKILPFTLLPEKSGQVGCNLRVLHYSFFKGLFPL